MSAATQRAVISGGRLRLVGQSRVVQTSIALIVSQVLLGVSGVVAARALGPSGRGVVAGVASWAGLLASLFLLGMNTSLGVRVARRSQDVGVASATALAYLALVGLPVAAVAAVTVPLIVGDLGANASGIARWAVPTTVILAMLSEMLMSISIARRRFFVFNGCRVLLPLIPLVVAVGYSASGTLTPTVMIAAGVAAAAACLLWLVMSNPWKKTRFDRGAFIADLRFGATSAVSNWAGMANARLDFLLMSAFVSASQLGYYGVANNVMLPVLTIPSAAATVLVPRVAGLLEANGSDKNAIIRSQSSLIWAALRRYLVISAVGGVALAFAAPLAVPLLFGTSFRPAIVLIWILIPGFVARAAMVILANATTAMRYPRVGNTAEIASLFVTVSLLAILLPRYGALGAAIASTVAYTVAAVTAAAGLRRLDAAAALRMNAAT